MNNDEIYNTLVDLKIQIAAYRAETSAQNTVTNTQLISINNHLKTLNGRVNKIEDRITPLENHVENTGDYSTKIRTLEDNALTTKSIKKWIVGTIAVVGALMSIMFIVFKIIQDVV